MHQETELGYCEISDDNNNIKTIRELEGRGMMIRSRTIDRSTVVHWHSSCVAKSGKLANKDSNVAFLMDEKVRTCVGYIPLIRLGLGRWGWVMKSWHLVGFI